MEFVCPFQTLYIFVYEPLMYAYFLIRGSAVRLQCFALY
jgi:hypothetical protein